MPASNEISAQNGIEQVLVQCHLLGEPTDDDIKPFGHLIKGIWSAPFGVDRLPGHRVPLRWSVSS